MRRHSGGVPRQRGGKPAAAEESSSDEDDAFSALSKRRKNSKKDKKQSKTTTCEQDRGESDRKGSKGSSSQQQIALPASTTSSMKRHHVTSNESRKAKMDALLLELEAEKTRRPYSNNHPNGNAGGGQFDEYRKGFVPDKKGSFVDPGEEHLTTNIFVGNLAPSITEEQLTDLFRQFGDLYSVKIMWPRTAEERARNRNTGFVCFMNRVDAEIAMEECSEKDPFHVGRRLMMRWGKNVKKTIKRGTGGVMQQQKRSLSSMHQDDPPRKKTKDEQTSTTVSKSKEEMDSSSSKDDDKNVAKSAAPKVGKRIEYDPKIHQKDAVRVTIPQNSTRAHFITTVASFVAKDGSIFERKLMDLESHNPEFDFLSVSQKLLQQQMVHDITNISSSSLEEHKYYRWRVYSFCQGDGINAWRTQPFQMIHPNGKFWIPPEIVDLEAARKEEEEERMREDSIRQKQQRRRTQRNMMSAVNSNNASRKNKQQQDGARNENDRGGGDTGNELLSSEELQQLNALIYKKLSISRTSICEAMSYCFEKSFAAKQISNALKESIMETNKSLPSSDGTSFTKKTVPISIDKRIARLYLLSDVLFNSQQPGIKNAFLYRNEIEKMAPEIFQFLGKYYGIGTMNKEDTDNDSKDNHHPQEKLGRLSLNKLKTAVGSILSAWTNWSVYNPMFMDDLQSYFEGKEVKKEEKSIKEDATNDIENSKEEQEDLLAQSVQILTSDNQRRGGWTEVTNKEDQEDGSGTMEESLTQQKAKKGGNSADGISQSATDDEKNRKKSSENMGIISHNDISVKSGNEFFSEKSSKGCHDKDGSQSREQVCDNSNNEKDSYIDEKIEELIDKDVDGEPLLSDDEIDYGETSAEEGIDGNSVHENIDGEPLDEEDIDGKTLENDKLDDE